MQASLFNITQEAITRAELHADPQWKQKAYKAVQDLVDRVPRFTADDVWNLLDYQEVYTHEPRAMGAVIQLAVKNRLIRHTGKYKKSERKEAHQRPISIYESLWQSWVNLPFP